MPVITCTTNADSHPGLIDQNQQTRRTRQQIEEDNTRAKSAAKNTRKKAERSHQESITSIAMMEDAIEWEEQDVQRYTMRPDLQLAPKISAKPVGSDANYETGLVLIICTLTS
jgi:hypothetical protein